MTSRSPINYDDDVIEDDDDEDDVSVVDRNMELMYNDFFSERRNPVKMLTTDLIATFRACNPDFIYNPNVRILPRALTNPPVPFSNDGLDNENNDLIVRVGDVLTGTPVIINNSNSHINSTHQQVSTTCSWLLDSRYTVVKMLGNGTFGQVLLCKDEENGNFVAVKVLKNRSAYFRQGLVEVAILTALNTDYDPTGERHTLRILDHFMCNDHLCIVNELLGCTLFEIIRKHKFRGLPIRTIKAYLRQILDALIVLDRAGIVHCDLKPENVLADTHCTRDGAERLTLIDFGSACFEGNSPHTYIQSRNYRSPEVILGLQATSAIDMWSFGCIAAELLLGPPLFPGSSEYNQLFKIINFLGPLPDDMIRFGASSDKYFKVDTGILSGGKNDFSFLLKTPTEFEFENGVKIEPDKKFIPYSSLEEIFALRPINTGYSSDESDYNFAYSEREIRRSFLSFLKGILALDPTKRWTASQARAHPFLNDVVLPENYVPPPPERMPRPIEQCKTPENLKYPRINGTYCELYDRFFGALRYENKIVDAYSGREIITLRNTVAPHYIRYRNVLMSSPIGAVTPTAVAVPPPPSPLHSHPASTSTTASSSSQHSRSSQIHLQSSQSSSSSSSATTQLLRNYRVNAQQQQQQNIHNQRMPSPPHHHLALNAYAVSSNDNINNNSNGCASVPGPCSLSSLAMSSNIQPSASSSSTTTSTFNIINTVNNNNNSNCIFSFMQNQSLQNNNTQFIKSQIPQQQQQQNQQQQQKGYFIGSPSVTNLKSSSTITIGSRPLLTSSSSSSCNPSLTSSTSNHSHYSSSYTSSSLQPSTSSSSSSLTLQHIAGKADIKRGTERLRKRNNISVRLFSPVQKSSAPPCDHIITLDLVPPTSNQPSSGSETPLRSIPAAARYPPLRSTSRIAIRRNSNAGCCCGNGGADSSMKLISSSVNECMSSGESSLGPMSELRSSGGENSTVTNNLNNNNVFNNNVNNNNNINSNVNNGNSIFALCGYGPFSNGNNGGINNNVDVNNNNNNSNNNNNNPWNRILYARNDNNDNDNDENMIFPITSTKLL